MTDVTNVTKNEVYYCSQCDMFFKIITQAMTHKLDHSLR